MIAHPADVIHLIGEFPGLCRTAEVAEDDSRGVRGEVSQRRRPLAGAGVEDNLMALTYKDPGGEVAESVGGAGDEDTRHGIILPHMACWYPIGRARPGQQGSCPAAPRPTVIPELGVPATVAFAGQRREEAILWSK